MCVGGGGGEGGGGGGGGGEGGDFLSSVSCHLTLVALLGRGRAVLPKLLSCCTRSVATVLQLLSLCCARPVDFALLRAPCGQCPSSARAEMTLLASSANPASSMLRLPKGFLNMPILVQKYTSSLSLAQLYACHYSQAILREQGIQFLISKWAVPPI